MMAGTSHWSRHALATGNNGDFRYPTRPKGNSIETFSFGIELFNQSGRLGADDLITQSEILPSVAHVLTHDGIQIVDVVQVYIVHLLHAGINISRHRDIHEDQRA